MRSIEGVAQSTKTSRSDVPTPGSPLGELSARLTEGVKRGELSARLTEGVEKKSAYPLSISARTFMLSPNKLMNPALSPWSYTSSPSNVAKASLHSEYFEVTPALMIFPL